jgi:hypothetical protein
MARGRGKRGGVRFSWMLSLPSQAAQTPEFAKVFCFFSSEKKTLLPEWRQMNVAFRISPGITRINPERGVHRSSRSATGRRKLIKAFPYGTNRTS